jgi:hypothetical protein
VDLIGDVVPRTTKTNNGTWSSGELQEGESWVMILGVSGVRDYFSEFHRDMTRVLEVALGLDPDFVRRDEKSRKNL